MPASPSPQPDPVPANRAERRGKATKPDLRHHDSGGPARPARTTAQGRRVNPVRRTG
jgi:hypothetical protein